MSLVRAALEEGILEEKADNGLYCRVCNCEMKGDIPAEAHLGGKQHEKCRKRYTCNSSPAAGHEQSKWNKGMSDEVEDMISKGVADGEIIRKEGYTLACAVCLIDVTGSVPMGQHLKSEAHKRKRMRRNCLHQPQVFVENGAPPRDVRNETPGRQIENSTPQSQEFPRERKEFNIIVIHDYESIPDPLF